MNHRYISLKVEVIVSVSRKSTNPKIEEEIMGLIVRTKPVGTKYLEGYPQSREMLQQVGWLQFLEKFNGFHKEVTKTFARSFKGTEVEVGDIKLTVTEVFIAEATGLLRHGERWFKNR